MARGQALQPVQVAGNVRAMGILPTIFNGDRDQANDFISKMEEYLLLNDNVPGFNSPKKRSHSPPPLCKDQR